MNYKWEHKIQVPVSVEDIKLTVWDYAIGQCTEGEILKLQRFFIREYFTWMPLRAIGEATGVTNHSTVWQSMGEVRRDDKLKKMIPPLKKIFDSKILGIKH